MSQRHTQNAIEVAGLESVLHQFDQRWQAGQTPDIEKFLPPADQSSATPAEWIGELAMIDLEYRWRRPADLSEPATVTTDAAGGKPLVRPLAEDYVRRFAQLKDDAKVLRDLVRQEYRVRHLWGDQPTHGSFRERFPALGDVLIDALRSVDEELQVEQPEPAERSTASKATGGTIGFGDGNNEVVPDAGQPKLSGQFGRYSILTKLGQGAMGDVHLAYDSKLERQVALKTPRLESKSRKEVVERFHREAKAAAQLRHPNICPVYDVGEIDGRLYLTMAYVEGETLSKHIDAADHLPATWIAKVIRGIASALAEAHRHGVVHRDLKPGNVMLDKNDQPVVTDFGLATLDVTSAEARLTATDAILGTPAYMSPEQLDKERGEIGPATDIYSLGVMLFEMLTGQLPFRGSLVSVLRQIPDQPPPRPSEVYPEVDPQLESLCLRMMAKAPADRPRSMDEVVAVIDQMQFDRDWVSVPESSKEHGKQSSLTRFGRIVALAVAAVLVGVAAYATTLIFKTPEGTVEIELGEGVGRDVQIEVKSLHSDRVLIADAGNNWRIEARAGDYTVNVRGGTDKFELSKTSIVVRRDKTAIVTITLKPEVVPAASEREIAEWLLSRHAHVNLISDVKKLRPGPVTVKTIYLSPPSEGFHSMSFLDSWFREIAKLKNIEHLQLAGVNELPQDAMEVISRMRKLRSLVFGQSVVTSGNLASLTDLPNLERLEVQGREIDDGALPHILKLGKLKCLSVRYSSLSETGLAQLIDLKDLERLMLDGTMLSDSTLMALASLSKLQEIHVRKTQVTEEAIADFKSKLLGCEVYWDETKPLDVPETRLTDRGSMAPSSLVAEPAIIVGLRSWTITTKRHLWSATCGEFSADGKQLATYGYDGVIRIWDVATRQFQRAIVTRGSASSTQQGGFTWSPDGKRFATLAVAPGYKGVADIWNANTGALLTRLPLSHPESSRPTWSPDGRYLAVYAADRIEVFDMSVSDVHTRLKTTRDLRDISWSPNSKMLATINLAGKVDVWNVETTDVVHAFNEEAASQYGEWVGWSPDGESVYSVSRNPGSLSAWDLDSGVGKTVQGIPKRLFAPYSLSRDGNSLATSHGVLRLDSAEFEEFELQLPRPYSEHFLDWSPDGKTLAFVTGRDGNIGFLTRENGKWKTALIERGHRSGYSNQNDIELMLSDVGHLSIDGPHRVPFTKLRSRAWEMSPDHQYVAYTDDETESRNTIVLKANERLFRLRGHTHDVTRVTFSADSRWLASIALKELKIWNTATRELYHSLEYDEDELRILRWAPVGNTLAVGHRKRVTLLNADTREQLVEIEASEDHVFSFSDLAFSPDGKQLVISDGDGRFGIFDVGTGTSIRRFLPKSNSSSNVLAWNELGIHVWDDDQLGSGYRAIVIDPMTGKSIQADRLSDAPFFVLDRNYVVELSNFGAGRVFDLCTREEHAVVYLRDDQWLIIHRHGHYLGSPEVEDDIAYVALTESGEQLILPPAEFATRFRWKNDPSKVPASSKSSKVPRGKKGGDQWKVNCLQMPFSWCPAGTFKMGSVPNWPTSIRPLDPVDVTITNGFWIGKFEVTQREWKAVLGKSIDQQWKDVWGTNLGHGGAGDELPIAWVGYNEVQEFLRILNERERKEDRLDKEWEFRLPTEAEWEYACRAGPDTATIYGNSPLNDKQANISFPGRAPAQAYTKVGSFPANAWGLHDMYGNVAEWTGDAAGPEFLGGKDPHNAPTRDNVNMVVRGGYMGTRSDELTSSWRTTPGRNGQPKYGFRVVLAPVTDER